MGYEKLLPSHQNQHLLMTSMESGKRNPDMIETIMFADVAEFKLMEAADKNKNNRGKLGLKIGN